MDKLGRILCWWRFPAWCAERLLPPTTLSKRPIRNLRSQVYGSRLCDPDAQIGGSGTVGHYPPSGAPRTTITSSSGLVTPHGVGAIRAAEGERCCGPFLGQSVGRDSDGLTPYLDRTRL